MELELPRPHPTPTTQPFWDGLARDAVCIQHCDSCQAWVYYPRARCPRCLGPRLSWHDVGGAGIVHSFSVARQATSPHFVHQVPQLLAIVELDAPCGEVRMTTTLVDIAPADIVIGLRVAPVFDHGADGVTLLRYRPVG